MTRAAIGLAFVTMSSVASIWGATVWATALSPRLKLPEPRQPEPIDSSVETEIATRDLSGFASVIWQAPPEPVVVESPPSPAAPPTVQVRLQLLGIARTYNDAHTATLEAVLYDPDLDEILIWSEGEGNGIVRCVRVTEDHVDLVTDTRTLTLRLDVSGGES